MIFTLSPQKTLEEAAAVTIEQLGPDYGGELFGKSWEDATNLAVQNASKTVKEIRSVYVQDMSAVVKNNKITEFRVNLKITFEVIS